MQGIKTNHFAILTISAPTAEARFWGVIRMDLVSNPMLNSTFSLQDKRW